MKGQRRANVVRGIRSLSDVTVPVVTRRVSLRLRWHVWRSALTAPALLSRFDETRIVSGIAAVNGGLSILILGAFAWLTETPLLFPALGPTAFILFSAPLSPAAAPRSVVLGHLVAMATGFLVWHAVSATAGYPVHIAGGWTPIVSAALALALTSLLLVRFGCPHPPACASSLIVALGAAADWTRLLLMFVAVVWIAAQAVAINRVVGIPAPRWAPHRLPCA